MENPGSSVLMRAATVVEPGKIEIQEVPIPQPEKGQVRIRLEGCGVCASNIPPWEGREWFEYPMEPGGLGHEGWGYIDAIGPQVTRFEVGDRVAFLSNHSYAEFDLAGEDSVVRLPENLEGKPFPGEPLGCAVNILARSRVKSGDTISIVGIGFLGSLLIQLCRNVGATVVAVDRKQGSLDIASKMGASQVILMDDHWRVIEQVKSLTEGHMCDVVIEAVGKQWPLDLAAELTKEMGRLVIAGYHQDGLRQVNMQLWNWRGLEVTNAHEREPSMYIRGIEKAMVEVSAERLKPDPLYSHHFPLEQLNLALDMVRDRPPGFMKALVLMGEQPQ